MNRRVIGGASIYTGAILWLLRDQLPLPDRKEQKVPGLALLGVGLLFLRE